MKLGTRMKITYAMVFIVPLLLIGISFCGIGRLELQQLGGRYGVADANLSITSDPFSMFNNIGNTVISQLQTTIQEKPAALDDVSYLEDINSQLGTYSSFIIVRRQGEIYFNGSDDDDVVIEDTDGYQPAGNYIIGDTPYHLRQIDFNFANGDEGSIQILTPVTMVVDQLRNIYTRLLVISVIILFVASSIAIFWLYQSIVQPLGKLKVAAENIKDGNLDFNVVTEAEDEIGELCTAFEEMRSKLKEQIDINMQYEKENKELISRISRLKEDARKFEAQLKDRHSENEYQALLKEKNSIELKIDRLSILRNEITSLEQRRAEIQSAIADGNLKATNYAASCPLTVQSQHFQQLMSQFGEDIQAGISLSVNDKKNQTQFNLTVSAQAGQSTGITNEMILAYDWLLLTHGSNHNLGFVWHDNALFADIDGGHRAKWMEFIYQNSIDTGKQYIMSINSENFDKSSQNWTDSMMRKLEERIVLKLSGENDTDKLLGI